MLKEGVQRGAYLFQRLRQLQECPPKNPDLARVRGIHPVDRLVVGLKPCRHLTSTPLLCRTAEYIWMFQDTQVLSTPSIPEMPVMVVFYHITQRSAEKIFVVDMSRMIIGHIKSSVF